MTIDIGEQIVIQTPLTTTKAKIKKIEAKCTECESLAIDYDDIRDEYICMDCGLVLAGPPAYVAGLVRIDYPWGNIYNTEFEIDNDDNSPVNAFYGLGIPRLPCNIV